MESAPSAESRLGRSAAAAVGAPVRAVGVFAPEGAHARAVGAGMAGIACGALVAGAAAAAGGMTARGKRLPRKVVLALGDDAVHVLRKGMFGPPQPFARWPLADMSATTMPKKVTVALHVRLRSGEQYRLETPLGRGEHTDHVAYRIARAGQPSV